MRLEDFPKDIQSYLIPDQSGRLIYRCLGCGLEYEVHRRPEAQRLFYQLGDERRLASYPLEERWVFEQRDQRAADQMGRCFGAAEVGEDRDAEHLDRRERVTLLLGLHQQ